MIQLVISSLHSKLSFLLYIGDITKSGDSDCNGIESFSEGIELSGRGNGQEKWVPLKFYTPEALSNPVDLSSLNEATGLSLSETTELSLTVGEVPVMW